MTSIRPPVFRTELPTALLGSLFGTLLCGHATTQETPQDPVLQRLERLEQENRDLKIRLDGVESENSARDEGFSALAAEIERLDLRDVMPRIGEQKYGLGPAASKVYGVEQGLSIGGYGEIVFTGRSNELDQFDALRNVLYFGYKFTDRWVLNTEIEFEHATTDASSGSTDSRGSVSLEFATLDYLADEAFNARAGVVLVPMGLINELHEPTTFLSANRPQTEQRIIPTTWRTTGAGAFGHVGGFDYRVYAVSALDGEEFGAGGLRGGRQKGNRSASDDMALTGRLDFTEVEGLLLGASFYWGDTGQDGINADGDLIPELNTTIVDFHGDWRPGDWRLRALYAHAWIDDAAGFNASTGEALADRMQGYYGEIGYDIASWITADPSQSLVPFFRYERVDTQQAMPGATAPDGTRDETIHTFGVSYQPIQELVFKLDFEDRDQSADRFNILMGWVF